MTAADLLEMRGISKTFPGVRALNRVDFACRTAEIHGLIGENGAGKSTLVKILAGAYHADEGMIRLNGQLCSFASPKDAREAGIGVIYQEFNLLPHMSVADNIFLGREPHRRVMVDHRQMRHEAQAILDQLGGHVEARQMVGQLTVAQQQIVEIVKALSLNANLIVMDEPSATLGGQELERLFHIMRSLKERGVTLIYISHRLSEIFEVCDRVTVLKDGELIGVRNVAETSEPELVSMMVGRQFEDVFPSPAPANGKQVVLQVRSLGSGQSVRDVSFELYAGEVLGVAGLTGSGRTELARAIFGADTHVTGEIHLAGMPVHITSPKLAIEAGITLAPEDRKAHGLLVGLSVGKNITLPILKRFRRFVALSRKLEEKAVQQLVQSLGIKVTGTGQVVRQLSGGNQQKVVLAKCLGSRPKVLILDEPTRGIDVGAKFEIYRLVRELADKGTAIIFISSELPEILGMSDRVLVMSRGRLMGILDRDAASEERVMALATGSLSQNETGEGANP